MNKEFLGRGWAFPFHFDPATGAVAYSEFEETVGEDEAWRLSESNRSSVKEKRKNLGLD